MNLAERVDPLEQVAALPLLVVGDARGDDPLHGEPEGVRVAAGGEGLVLDPHETGFGEPALGLGEHDVGWNQTLRSLLEALEGRDHGAHGRIDQPAAGHPSGLHHVGGRLVAVLAVRHAADDRVLVGHLGQLGEQLPIRIPLTLVSIARSTDRCNRCPLPAWDRTCRCGSDRPTARSG